MKKRSASLSLVLMGSLAVGVGGCSEDPGEEFRVYTSIDECVQEQVYSTQECRDSAIAAVKQNPQFANQAECEKEFGEGSCKKFDARGTSGENVQGERHSSWMPLITGYMVGRFLGGGGYMQGAQPVYAPPQKQPATGARTSGGFAKSFRTLGGGRVETNSKGFVSNPSESVRKGFTRSAKPYAGRTGAGSRGGFSGSKSFGSSGS